MRFYKKIRQLLLDQSAKCFWSIWWTTADKVVLPLQPADVCTWPSRTWKEVEQISSGLPNELKSFYRDILLNSTEDRWAALLESHGYQEWAFVDVIKHHFTRLWLRAKEHHQRRRSWKRHRLMLKPRFISQKARSVSTATRDNEWQWVCDSDDEWVWMH